eukprot:TRINITY_DN27565_c0_g1_i1.p1 TRINITY_DN27565_c0_g1~~TRINITY_DN27565_c0_g1_i1.p1  ORF type:complete len:383 (+),score=80.74 TRINITY_DN27565_c0_g1_i1:66-1151(+)
MAKADPDLDPVWGLLESAIEFPDAPVAASPSTVEGGAESFPETASRVSEADLPEGGRGYGGKLTEKGQAADTHPISKAAYKADESKPISNVVDKEEVPASRFPLLPCLESFPEVQRQEIQGCDAFILDGVLSQQECQLLMRQAEGFWSFWETDPDRPRAAFRNAHTVEVTHQELADRIWERVGRLVQPSVTLAEDDARFEVDIEGKWVPYGMNPNMLLSRYLDGGHFSPHTDGTTVVDFNRRTFYSCVLFLNASPWGGHTRIYADAQMQKDLRKDEAGRLTGEPSLVLAEVPPKAGRMLVFYHRLMHEGVPAAEKYIIRTDVFYRRTPELCTAPEDAEADAAPPCFQALPGSPAVCRKWPL